MTAVASTVERPSIAAQLPELRAALEEQRSFRQGQLADLTATAASGPATTMGDVHDDVADALRAGATKALFEIEAAVARIETGRYGACEDCNGAIPLERLETLPMAALCMRCARARYVWKTNR